MRLGRKPHRCMRQEQNGAGREVVGRSHRILLFRSRVQEGNGEGTCFIEQKEGHRIFKFEMWRGNEEISLRKA